MDFAWARNRLFDKNCCEAFLMVCQADSTAHIINVTNKPKNKWRPQALDTIELEKLGSRKLKMSAKQTMTIAEKLYTQGFISYPRTETNMFSNDIKLRYATYNIQISNITCVKNFDFCISCNKYRPLVEMQCAHPAWGQFANRVLEWGPSPRNGNKSDQAHPPIHPTKFTTGKCDCHCYRSNATCA